MVPPNRLQRQFAAEHSDQASVLDITYIYCTYEGWLYLTVVIDLHSGAAVGRSMKPTMATELALDTLTMSYKNLRLHTERKPLTHIILAPHRRAAYPKCSNQSRNVVA